MNENTEKVLKKREADETEFSQYRLPSISDVMEKYNTIKVVLTDIDFIEDGVIISYMTPKSTDVQKLFTISKPVIQSLRNAISAELSLPVSAKLIKLKSETSGQTYYDIV